MAKKSESSKAHKVHSPKQDRAQKPGREERPGNAGGRSQEGLERNMEKDRDRDRKKMDGGNTKKGCFPKLFMLLLPFVAVGTYLFLWS